MSRSNSDIVRGLSLPSVTPLLAPLPELLRRVVVEQVDVARRRCRGTSAPQPPRETTTSRSASNGVSRLHPIEKRNPVQQLEADLAHPWADDDRLLVAAPCAAASPARRPLLRVGASTADSRDTRARDDVASSTNSLIGFMPSSQSKTDSVICTSVPVTVTGRSCRCRFRVTRVTRGGTSRHEQRRPDTARARSG